MVEELLKRSSEILSSMVNSQHRVSNTDQLELVTKSIKDDQLKNEGVEGENHYA